MRNLLVFKKPKSRIQSVKDKTAKVLDSLYFKSAVMVLVIIGSALLGWHRYVQATAATNCVYRATPNQTWDGTGTNPPLDHNNVWNEAGYHYATWDFDLSGHHSPNLGNVENIQIASNGGWADNLDHTSGNCFSAAGSNMPQNNVITFGFDSADKYNPSNPTSYLSYTAPAGAPAVRATDVRLGTPYRGAIGPRPACSPSNGAANNKFMPPPISNGSTFNCAGDAGPGDQSAASFDDAGKSTINSRTIWCEGLGGDNHCDQTARNTGDFGAGFTFVNDNCSVPHLDKVNFNGYNDFSFDAPHGGNCGNNSYPQSQAWWSSYHTYQSYFDIIGNIVSQGSNRYLNNFSLGLQAKSTQSGGISAHSKMTFKYPITPVVKIDKTPSGCSFQVNTQVAQGCTGTNGYLITVTKQNNGLLASFKLIDDLPTQYTVYEGSCPGFPAPSSGPAVGTTTGGTVSWVFSSGMVNALNSNSPVYLCLNVKTAPSIPGGLVAFTNAIGAQGNSVGTTPALIVNNGLRVTNFIYTPEQPYLTTNLGDVHAGGGIGLNINCGSPGGSITGLPAGSKGDYVVSAGGVVSGFGSNAATTGSNISNSLTASGYQQVCRPDLATQANNYVGPAIPKHLPAPAWNGQENQILGNSTCPSGVTPDPNGKLIIISGSITIANSHNCVDGAVTLFVNGDITIAPNVNITYDPSYLGPANEVPSLGLITTGNIYIEGSDIHNRVLNGYYYANGQINTCANGLGQYPASQLVTKCAHPLFLTGLMSANSFIFDRVASSFTSGLTPTETVTFDGRLLIDPPPVFASSISSTPTLPVGQEEPPQF